MNEAWIFDSKICEKQVEKKIAIEIHDLSLEKSVSHSSVSLAFHPFLHFILFFFQEENDRL